MKSSDFRLDSVNPQDSIVFSVDEPEPEFNNLAMYLPIVLKASLT